MALGKALILRSRRRRRLEGGTALVHLIFIRLRRSAAVIAGRNEWQPDDSRRPRGAAHQELQGLALHGVLGSDVAHCDRPADRGAEAAAGYFPQCAPCVIDNLGVLARRRAPVQTDADALAARPLDELAQYRGGTGEAAFGAAPLPDRPSEIGFDRGRGFVDVMPIKAESRLEPQR